MDTIQTIKQRRSIRNFDNKEIQEQDLDLILQSAMLAPTARNQQGWRFVVIDDQEILNKISLNIQHAKMCKDANKAIVVCYEITDESSQLYWVQDASAATQNILLSATSLGIGSVWIAVHPREQKIQFISELLNLPENIKPLCVVALGYKENFLKEVNRYDKNKIKYNSWK